MLGVSNVGIRRYSALPADTYSRARSSIRIPHVSEACLRTGLADRPSRQGGYGKVRGVCLPGSALGNPGLYLERIPPTPPGPPPPSPFPHQLPPTPPPH